MPKLVVEKRPLSSSEDSDKENISKKRAANVDDSREETSSTSSLSPLYQNQQGHPAYPFDENPETISSSEKGNMINELHEMFNCNYKNFCANSIFSFSDVCATEDATNS